MKKFFSNTAVTIGIIIIFGVFIILLIWRQQLEQLRTDRQTTISQGVQQNDNLVLALENYSIRTIQNADILLDDIRNDYVASKSFPDYTKLLNKPSIDPGLINGISILDKEGRIISSNFSFTNNPVLNFSDRLYFKFHQANKEDKLYFSKPLFSRTLNKPVISLSRRINNADGSFGGIVAIQIIPFSFTRFYEGATVKKDDIVSLIATDGITYVRRTGDVPGYGEDISKSPLFKHVAADPVGHYYAKDAIKGIATYFSYRKLKNYPIIATIGKAEHDLLALYKLREKRELVTTTVISFLILVFISILCIGLVRRKRYLHVLSASEARYRLMFENSKEAIFLFEAEGEIKAMNPAAANIFKINAAAADTGSLNIAALLYPESAHVSALPDFSASIQSLNGEHRFFRSDGSSFLGELLVSSYSGYNSKNMFIAVIRDFSERRELQRKLIHEKRSRQQLINRQVILAQEQERESIGGELHDNVCQLLSTVKLFLGMIEKQGDANNNLLPRSLELLDKSIDEIRVISHKMISPAFGDRSLVEAIRDLLQSVQESSALHVHFKSSAINHEPDIDMKLAVYRILQEQVNNILKHAAATDVMVSISEKEDTLCLTVTDNGKGFDTSLNRKGIGLNNIESRAKAFGGSVQLQSAPGQGCKLQVIFPVYVEENNEPIPLYSIS